MIRRDWRWVFLVTTAVVGTTCALLIPNALAKAVDMALAGTLDAPTVLWLLTVTGTEIAVDTASIVVAAGLTSRATAWLRHRVAHHLLRLGHPAPFAAGDGVSRLTGDSAIAGGFAVLLVNLGITVVSSAGAVVALALLDWRLAVVFLASVPFGLLLVRTHMRLTADDVLAYQQVSGDLAARLLDAVGGLRTIAASGTAEQEATRVLRPLPDLAAAGIGMWRTQARMIWRAGLLVPTVQLSVLTAAGFGVVAGRISVGSMLAVLGYTALAMGIVGQLSQLTTLERTRASGTRLAEVLDSPAPAHGELVLPAGAGDLDIRGVYDVDLHVPAGTFLAVVGRSGSGKSTLASAIGGLSTPARGQVLLDGVPLSDLTSGSLHAAVGVAFERPALLGGTVADSVGYGIAVEDALVRAACEAAQVHDVVVRLPDGYATPMADTPLSGGEAQRLGLARAIVRDPRVLVLDDATASLDTVTESKVDQAIDSALPGRTRVVVTHRAATATRADVVVWMEDGHVRGTGTHDDLWQHPDYRSVFTGGDA
nr:ABC transporter ATP-binding protein [Lentzea tibetensis]